MTRVAVSGHRGFSSEVTELVAAGLDRELDRVAAHGSAIVGLSCLADGADQIFAAAVLRRGGSLEVVVPADEYRDGLPDSAKPQYDKFLAEATVVHRCTYRESTSEAHMSASRLMVDNSDELLAVWDGEPARAFGGTADVVAYARAQGVPVAIVWPEGARR